MNRPLFAVLGIACFAAGWWVDAWAGENGAAVSAASTGGRDGAAPAPAAAGVVAVTENKSALAAGAAAGVRILPGIHTVEDLLKAALPGRSFASRAQLDRAAAGLPVEALAKMAAELRQIKEYPGLTREDIRSAREAVVSRWLELAPGPAVEHCFETHFIGDLEQPVYKALANVFKEDLATAVRLMEGAGRELYIFARFECIASMKGMDPRTALETIVDFDNRTGNEQREAEALGDFPRLWVEKDAPAALTWALQLPPCYTRHRILWEMAGDWGKIDPAAARAFMAGVPESVLPKGALREKMTDAITPVERRAAQKKEEGTAP